MDIPSPRSTRRARIEIIPLIDIIFFLLATFVMVSLSMVKNQGIGVNLPVATSSAPQPREDAAVISITSSGELFLNKAPITMLQLVESLKSLSAAQPELKVFINGDVKAEFGQAIAVLDEVRKLGITRIAIQTQPTPKP